VSVIVVGLNHRTAPVEMHRSPRPTSFCSEPAVPMRMKVSAPTLISSSMAMAVEGQPMPVEVQDSLMPSTVPVKVRYSRLKATSWASSK